MPAGPAWPRDGPRCGWSPMHDGVSIGAAMRDRAMSADRTPETLALHIQAVLQGAFILAKAKGGAQVAPTAWTT